MGKYTDANAPCATVVESDPNTGTVKVCGHFPADHTWDDPWKRNEEETYTLSDTAADKQAKDAAFSARWNKQLAQDKDGAQKREAAQFDRRNCHAYTGAKTCVCKSYSDSTQSVADRAAAAAAEKAAADQAMQKRIDDAVAKALAERDRQQAAATKSASGSS